MSGNVSDEELRRELLKLIEETRNQIPKKAEMKEAVIARSFIVFALGCFTGIEMYTINLFLTSKIRNKPDAPDTLLCNRITNWEYL